MPRAADGKRGHQSPTLASGSPPSSRRSCSRISPRPIRSRRAATGHRARPCALAQARAHDGHDGRRRDRGERAGQGLGVYGAAARELRARLNCCGAYVALWHKADILRQSAISRFRGKADISVLTSRFMSTRPRYMKSCCLPTWPHSSRGSSCARRRPVTSRRVSRQKLKRARDSAHTSAGRAPQL